MSRHGINLLLIGLVLLNIMDGDFSEFSILEIFKLLLLVFCFYLNNRKED